MTINPKSHHVNDPLLQPFLNPTFSATEYLNNVLPPLHVSAPSQTTKPLQSLSLSELTAQTQSHITQLSAQTSRLSETLTQLTDDILRSGSRLAYEVEVLRGEALSLQDALNETLQHDIKQLLPNGLSSDATSSAEPDKQVSDQQDLTSNKEAPVPLDTLANLSSAAKASDTTPPTPPHQPPPPPKRGPHPYIK